MSVQETSPEGLSLEEKAAIVETSEARWFEIIYGGFSPAIMADYGAEWQKVGGATAVFFEKIPITAFNRVIGLGVHQPATEEMIEEAITIYGRKNLPFMIGVSPAAQPAQLTDWLLERGFKPAGNWAKVIRGSAPPPDVKTDLRIEPVTDANVAEYSKVIIGGFGMPDWTAPMFEDLARVPGVYSFLAYAGDEPAGVGSMIVNGDFCHLFNGATLPEFRRRGAQGAIMARRIEEGIQQGCRWFMTETEEDTPEHSNPSYRNMLRTGFQLAYLRPNYEYGG